MDLAAAKARLSAKKQLHEMKKATDAALAECQDSTEESPPYDPFAASATYASPDDAGGDVAMTIPTPHSALPTKKLSFSRAFGSPPTLPEAEGEVQEAMSLTFSASSFADASESAMVVSSSASSSSASESTTIVPPGIVYGSNSSASSSSTSILSTKTATTAASSSAGEALQVYLRLRPMNDGEKRAAIIPGSGGEVMEPCIIPEGMHSVKIAAPELSQSFKHGERNGSFTFSRVYGAASPQEEIFNNLMAQPTRDAISHGKHALVFAYGMTNAGKTFTILGTEENPGILPRTLNAVFQQLNSGSAGVASASSSSASSRPSPAPQDFHVLVSYMEIYNEHCYDLLANVGGGGGASTAAASKKASATAVGVSASSSSSSSAAASSGTRVPLKLKDGKDGLTVVQGMKHIVVKSPKAAIDIMREGANNKRVADTALNTDSSRSHTVFQISFYYKDASAVEGGIETAAGGAPEVISAVTGAANPGFRLWSRLNIVDLAGSERQSRTQSEGTRLQEAGKINASLMTLKKCLETMRFNASLPPPPKGGAAAAAAATAGSKPTHHQPLPVPFRESKLTRLFSDSLGGRTTGSTIMIVNAGPSHADFDETLAVLKYGALAQELRVVKDRIVAIKEPTYGEDGKKLLTKEEAAAAAAATAAAAAARRQPKAPAPLHATRSRHGSSSSSSAASGGGEGGLLSTHSSAHSLTSLGSSNTLMTGKESIGSLNSVSSSISATLVTAALAGGGGGGGGAAAGKSTKGTGGYAAASKRSAKDLAPSRIKSSAPLHAGGEEDDMLAAPLPHSADMVDLAAEDGFADEDSAAAPISVITMDAEAQATITALEAALAASEERGASLAERLASTQDAHAALEDEKEELEEAIRSLSRENEKLVANLEEAQQRADDIEANVRDECAGEMERQIKKLEEDMAKRLAADEVRMRENMEKQAKLQALKGGGVGGSNSSSSTATSAVAAAVAASAAASASAVNAKGAASKKAKSKKSNLASSVSAPAPTSISAIAAVPVEGPEAVMMAVDVGASLAPFGGDEEGGEDLDASSSSSQASELKIRKTLLGFRVRLSSISNAHGGGGGRSSHAPSGASSLSGGGRSSHSHNAPYPRGSMAGGEDEEGPFDGDEEEEDALSLGGRFSSSYSSKVDELLAQVTECEEEITRLAARHKEALREAAARLAASEEERGELEKRLALAQATLDASEEEEESRLEAAEAALRPRCDFGHAEAIAALRADVARLRGELEAAEVGARTASSASLEETEAMRARAEVAEAAAAAAAAEVKKPAPMSTIGTSPMPTSKNAVHASIAIGTSPFPSAKKVTASEKASISVGTSPFPTVISSASAKKEVAPTAMASTVASSTASSSKKAVATAALPPTPLPMSPPPSSISETLSPLLPTHALNCSGGHNSSGSGMGARKVSTTSSKRSSYDSTFEEFLASGESAAPVSSVTSPAASSAASIAPSSSSGAASSAEERNSGQKRSRGSMSGPSEATISSSAVGEVVEEMAEGEGSTQLFAAPSSDNAMAIGEHEDGEKFEEGDAVREASAPEDEEEEESAAAGGEETMAPATAAVIVSPSPAASAATQKGKGRGKAAAAAAVAPSKILAASISPKAFSPKFKTGVASSSATASIAAKSTSSAPAAASEAVNATAPREAKRSKKAATSSTTSDSNIPAVIPTIATSTNSSSNSSAAVSSVTSPIFPSTATVSTFKAGVGRKYGKAAADASNVFGRLSSTSGIFSSTASASAIHSTTNAFSPQAIASTSTAATSTTATAATLASRRGEWRSPMSMSPGVKKLPTTTSAAAGGGFRSPLGSVTETSTAATAAATAGGPRFFRATFGDISNSIAGNSAAAPMVEDAATTTVGGGKKAALGGGKKMLAVPPSTSSSSSNEAASIETSSTAASSTRTPLVKRLRTRK